MDDSTDVCSALVISVYLCVYISMYLSMYLCILGRHIFAWREAGNMSILGDSHYEDMRRCELTVCICICIYLCVCVFVCM